MLMIALGCADPGKDHGPSTSGSTATTPACAADPLPEGWDALTAEVLGPVDLTPGATRELAVYAVGPGWVQAAPLCESWSVGPPNAGLSIADGVLSVDPSTPDGVEATVTATIPAGAIPGEDQPIELDLSVFVYDPAVRPWVGTWTEVATIDCATGQEQPPADPIGEVSIRAGGDVAVTWSPFELYVDWWGQAGWDLGAGTVSLAPTGGNYVPTDIDGEGTFAVDGDDLVLRDLWLGSARAPTGPAGCGHRLR